MTTTQKTLPNWILIVSGIFALMELGISVVMWVSPQTLAETIDLSAKGVVYLIQMWAIRQFALGFIFAYATFKKSIPMLSLCYIFFTVMMAGDFVAGIIQKENVLNISALVMGVISLAMIYALNKRP